MSANSLAVQGKTIMKKQAVAGQHFDLKRSPFKWKETLILNLIDFRFDGSVN